jgi:hypothetical protein
MAHRLKTPESNGRPITVDEGREFIGREPRHAGLARFVHGEIGLAEHVAHGLGPGFFVELDQTLEFAQDMGVAEGVVDRVEPAIRQEVVMHDHAPLQIRGIAPRFSPTRR